MYNYDFEYICPIKSKSQEVEQDGRLEDNSVSVHEWKELGYPRRGREGKSMGTMKDGQEN
jgi:hypothetical protein